MKVLIWLFIGLDQHETSEHLLTAIIEQLCCEGHSVHIVQKDTGGDLPSIPDKLKEYKITTTTIPFQKASKGNFIARYIKELKYVKDCKKLFNTQYDAVFIQSNNVAGFSVKAIRKKMANAVVTFNVQDIFPYNAVFSGSVEKNSFVFKVLAGVQRYGYKHSDHVITISEDMRATLLDDGVPEDKVDVIYNWSYQDELFSDVDLTPVAHIFDSAYYNIVYAGNIGVMQNVDILIETAKLMKTDKNIWFHIIGNGVHKEKLQARAREYGICNITFWPIQPPEIAPLVYSAADLNIIPLVKNVYRTALPSKTATCLACQKPIIFAIGKDSLFGKKVKEEAGCIVVDSDKPEELAQAIRTIQRGEYNSHLAGEFFLHYCMKTENSKRYADTITKR